MLILRCVYLFLAILAVVEAARPKQKQSQSGQLNRKEIKLCNSLRSFCAQCQRQSRNCKRMAENCAAVLRQEAENDRGSNNARENMELALCRLARAQCNSCKSQGNNCNNLRQQCRRNGNNGNNNNNPGGNHRPGGTTGKSSTTESSVQEEYGEEEGESNDEGIEDENHHFGELPVISQTIKPNRTSSSASSGSHQVTSGSSSCQKFGMRCHHRNQPCCQGLRCSTGEDDHNPEPDQHTDSSSDTSDSEDSSSFKFNRKGKKRGNSGRGKKATCVMVNSKDESQHLMSEIFTKRRNQNHGV